MTGKPDRMSVRQAASEGTERDLLVAMRDLIAGQLDTGAVMPRDMAALTKRLMDIVKEIAAVDAAERGDSVGDAADTPDEPFSS